MTKDGGIIEPKESFCSAFDIIETGSKERDRNNVDETMSDLALVQALFSKVWLPKGVMPNALPSTLVERVVVQSDPEIVDSKSVDSEVTCGQEHISQANSSLPKKEGKGLNLGVQVSEHNSVLEAPSDVVVKSSQQNRSATRTSAPILAVPAPDIFHIAATMIDLEWGLVLSLPPQQGGLPSDDYVMLSNLIHAMRQLLQRQKSPIDFDFFRWPPHRGLAKSLDVQGMGLSALKGFLHKMAMQKQCSWLVFDEQFAKFCFQKPEIHGLTVIPRGQHYLVVAPSLSQLKADAQLKKQLWLQLKSLIDGE